MVPEREGPEYRPDPPPKWGPYNNAGDFSACMAIILASLISALALALAVNTLIRRFIRRRSRRQHATGDVEKPAATMADALPADALPTVVFSSGAGIPGGASSMADCAICLQEFLDGDALRLLPDCGHGFHVGCVDRWIAARRSCPTCRKTCLTAASAPAEGFGP
ncbi:hypothetical protein HPP92_025404 [Vanilla planifolia]|uniref:RING-type domain-containing protein n=1 Tax=Vanilla planifolia TaxID=51239 RepID=A0A835U9C3_VANPL|nr:hypothetical protein HPP92_025404 [Vanilla planifolia]